MTRPEPRSFAPVEHEEDLPEDVLHWAQVFEDVAIERARREWLGAAHPKPEHGR